MSNIERFENIKQIVKMVQPQFDQLARIHGVVNYLEEASFALQALQDNDYLAGVAMSNPDSLKRAVINVATIGLSLNPYKKQAYLVPRKVNGALAVCLDISYVGYLQLAVDCGILKKWDIEMVRRNDVFVFKGFNEYPEHKFEMFDDEARGALIGGYVVATLSNGELVFTHMSMPEIYAIRDRSEGWKAYKSKGSRTIWVTDEIEMCKKTLAKRAKKSWPMPRKDSERIAKADEILAETDQILLTPAPEADDIERQDLLLKIRTALDILERSEASYVSYLMRINRRDLKTLQDLTKIEMKQALTALSQLVDTKNAKEMK